MSNIPTMAIPYPNCLNPNVTFGRDCYGGETGDSAKQDSAKREDTPISALDLYFLVVSGKVTYTIKLETM